MRCLPILVAIVYASLCGPNADPYCCIEQNCTLADENATNCDLPALIYCCQGITCVPSNEWWAGVSDESSDYDYSTDKGAMP
jgi:hypothetical protein